MPYSSFGRPATALSADGLHRDAAEHPDVGAGVVAHELGRPVLVLGVEVVDEQVRRLDQVVVDADQDEVVDVHRLAPPGENGLSAVVESDYTSERAPWRTVQPTCNTTLPTARPSATSRSAAATSSSANVAPMCGIDRPTRAGPSAPPRCARSSSGGVRGEVEELEAEDLDALEQHQVQGDAGDLARRVADGHEPAALAQRSQRGLGEVAAHRVDDDVGARRAARSRSACRRSTGRWSIRLAGAVRRRRPRASRATTRRR